MHCLAASLGRFQWVLSSIPSCDNQKVSRYCRTYPEGQNHPQVTTSVLIQVWAGVSADNRTAFTKKQSTYNVCEYSRPHKINHFCNLENIHSIFILQLLGQGGKGTQHSCWNCSIPWRGEKKDAISDFLRNWIFGMKWMSCICIEAK